MLDEVVVTVDGDTITLVESGRNASSTQLRAGAGRNRPAPMHWVMKDGIVVVRK